MASLDLKSPEFWDPSAVDRELRRVYDICSGCRRCLPLCPSFKVLFDRLDVDAVDGDVEKLPTRDVKEVVDLCYQCKLCFNHCPYTPPHRDRKSTRLNSSHGYISYAVFCLKKKKKNIT